MQMFRTISEKLERVDEIKNMLLQLQSSFQEFREDSVDRLNTAGPKAKTFRFLALDEKVSIHKKPKAPKRIVWEEPVQQDKEKEKTPPVRNAFLSKELIDQVLTTEHGAVIHRAGQFYFQLKKEFLETIRKNILDALEYATLKLK